MDTPTYDPPVGEPQVPTAHAGDAEHSVNDTLQARDIDTNLAAVAAQYERAATSPWKASVPPELSADDRPKLALAMSGPLHLWAFALGKLMENPVVVGRTRQTALPGFREWVDIGNTQVAVADSDAAEAMQKRMLADYWTLVEPHRRRILQRIDVIADTLKRGETVPMPTFIGVGTGQTFIVFEAGQEAERDALLAALNGAYQAAAKEQVTTMLTELRGLVDQASAATMGHG